MCRHSFNSDIINYDYKLIKQILTINLIKSLNVLLILKKPYIFVKCFIIYSFLLQKDIIIV